MDEAAVLAELQGSESAAEQGYNGRRCAAAVQDDYSWWKGHGQSPGAGKPLWLTLDDTQWQVAS